METILIIVGSILILVGLNTTYNPLNFRSVSMDFFTGISYEHGKGLQLKPLWWTIQKKIDMRSSILVTSDGTLRDSHDKNSREQPIKAETYESKDGVIYGKWTAVIKPLKGYLVNYLLKTPEVAALMLMADVNTEISDKLATKENEEIMASKKQISQEVSLLYGGEAGDPHEFEKRYGVAVSDPKLYDLSYGPKSQEAAERLFQVKKFKEAMKELDGQINDPKLRADTINVVTGVVGKKMFAIEDLDKATSNIAIAVLNFVTKKIS